jgi:hypothetical protein
MKGLSAVKAVLLRWRTPAKKSHHELVKEKRVRANARAQEVFSSWSKEDLKEVMYFLNGHSLLNRGKSPVTAAYMVIVEMHNVSHKFHTSLHYPSTLMEVEARQDACDTMLCDSATLMNYLTHPNRTLQLIAQVRINQGLGPTL